MGKSTRAETTNRINNVYDKLVSGWTQPAVVAYGIETWGVSEGAVRKYIQKANIAISKFAEEYREHAFEINLAKRSDLYRMALEDDDKRLALEVARDESKLLGLYAPEHSKIQSQNIEVDIKTLTDDQIKRLANGEDVLTVIADK
jgi:hypothetical protein